VKLTSGVAQIDHPMSGFKPGGGGVDLFKNPPATHCPVKNFSCALSFCTFSTHYISSKFITISCI
jgi:hypothetical protein